MHSEQIKDVMEKTMIKINRENAGWIPGIRINQWKTSGIIAKVEPP